MASVVKFAFTSKNGIVKPSDVVPKMGGEYDPDLLPEWIEEISKHQLFKKWQKKRGQCPLLYKIDLKIYAVSLEEATAKL